MMKKIDDIFKSLKKINVITISTDDFYNEVRNLTGDLIFLKELTSRMKKSRYDFACFPTLDRNINGLFLKKLWSAFIYNGWSINEDTTIIFLKTYYSVRDLFDILNNRDLTDNESSILCDLNEFLYDGFNMDLISHVSDFIGCSSSCRAVINKIKLNL